LRRSSRDYGNHEMENSPTIQRLFFPIKTIIMAQMKFGTVFTALEGLDCLCPIQHARL
jgi:hypothetical protein